MSAPQTAAIKPIADIQAIKALVNADMQAVDACIRERLRSDVALVNQIGEYIISAGGKRLRPTLVLLSARANRYQGEKHVDLAAIIEFIHTATLLHDDVVDESELRRGRDTANAVWGNAASVLVGDFLYSRSFQMMVDVSNLEIMSILADTTNTIAAGEVLQLMTMGNPDTSEESYLQVIQKKTAKLFEAAARLGAVIAGQPKEIESALASYGLNLGMAFQVADDLLDYASDAKTLGKNIGDDLAEGKVTLPLIYLLKHGTQEQRALTMRALEAHGSRGVQEVSAAVRASGALEYCYECAQAYVHEAQACLRLLPDSRYRAAMSELADFALARTF